MTSRPAEKPFDFASTPGKLPKADFASLQRIFGVAYPLSKLDQIALPVGFGGAMKN